MSSIQKLKDRAGAGGKISALQPQKSLVDNSLKDVGGGSCKKPQGKENPRSVSRGKLTPASQKPVVRLLPNQRIDRTVSNSSRDGGPYGRWSASSQPKGKSAETSDFALSLSDWREGRLSRAYTSVKNLEKPGTEISAGDKRLTDLKLNEKSQRKRENLSGNSTSEAEKLRNRTKIFDAANKRVNPVANSNEMAGNHVSVLNSCKSKIMLDSIVEKREGGASYACQRSDNGFDCMIMNSKGDDLEKNLKDTVKNDIIGLEAPKDGPSLPCSGPNQEGSTSTNTHETVTFDDSTACHAFTVKSVQQPNSSECLDLRETKKGSFDGARVSGSSNDTTYIGPTTGELSENSLKGPTSLDECRKRDHREENIAVRVVNKHPSKLREKLAFLERKVNRIASDIKRTKEMLESNNPDSSKLMLANIQDEILGIEKAMGHVPDDNKNKSALTCNVEVVGVPSKFAENSLNWNCGRGATSVGGLNAQEMEARFFPHHKLIRSRTSVGTLTGGVQNSQTDVKESSGVNEVNDQLLIPADENPIALEFLASLEKDQLKINPDNRIILVECLTMPMTELNDTECSSARQISKRVMIDKQCDSYQLSTNENSEDFNDQENKCSMQFLEEPEDFSVDQLYQIGHKTSTGGWFVSEGESVLLVHSDNTCSFYDIVNSEEKAEYRAPKSISYNLWRDCWLIRAPGSDGCTGRYVVAASAGNTLDSGFCSWDFYSKDIKAFRIEDETSTDNSSRAILGSLANREVDRSAMPPVSSTTTKQWWYKPSGPLLVSTATSEKVVTIYDIRDGDVLIKWEASKPVLTMDYSSPLQWRNRGKLVLAETQGISLWDVNCPNPQPLLSLPLFGKRIAALHVNNTDAELGGGVRQRISSTDVEGNDGLFCTNETIEVLDFRIPSGIGLKMSKHRTSHSHSIFSRGDSILLGVTDKKLDRPCSQIQQFSLRKGKLLSTYLLEESNAHTDFSSLTQVWGNSQFVMGVCGLGLSVFDTCKDVGMPCPGNSSVVRDTIGPKDLYSPSFDYLSSRVLLISRDRPASWRYLT